jgi:pimeloyl-ACP methyl ester carboxylesterase
VLPDLVEAHHVVAPDLPAHGETRVPDGWGGIDRVIDWLDALVDCTCPAPPTIVGHVLGGAIAARYAATRDTRAARLVLVDTLGLARFRPSPKFAMTFLGFQASPPSAATRGSCASAPTTWTA